MKKIYFGFGLIFLSSIFCLAQSTAREWRMATHDELQSMIPARAPVESERIETEMRTASGVTNGKGKYIAGVVLITAGYSADGKYSHFFLTQVPIKIAGFDLHAGQYVIGWKHQNGTLAVSFYEAATGRMVGTVTAERQSGSRVDSFRMTPPSGTSRIIIGRFSFAYHLAANATLLPLKQ